MGQFQCSNHDDCIGDIHRRHPPTIVEIWMHPQRVARQGQWFIGVTGSLVQASENHPYQFALTRLLRHKTAHQAVRGAQDTYVAL
jgi:hypothetical protein